MHLPVKRQHRSRKNERLEVRVTADQKRLIERASELRGSTVTDFVVATTTFAMVTRTCTSMGSRSILSDSA
jgi:hypothetical protein